MRRRLKTPFADDEERFLLRVAWSYYVEGLTQNEVAEKLRVTRLRVNRALAEARRTGLVRFSFNTAYAGCAEIESALSEEFGLTTAFVVPAPAREEDTQTVVGAALGNFLGEVLADPQVSRFGMSWGNTLNLATRFMRPLDRPDPEIISVMGGLTRGSDLNSFDITTRLADLANARHSYFDRAAVRWFPRQP